jgi:hypothetical protein
MTIDKSRALVNPFKRVEGDAEICALSQLLKKVQMQGGRPSISNFELRISNLSTRGLFSAAC